MYQAMMDDAIEYPLTCWELARYMDYLRDTSVYAKTAYRLYPQFGKLAYFAQESANQLARGSYMNISLDDSILLDDPSPIFTPAYNMAIGHYMVSMDWITVLRLFGHKDTDMSLEFIDSGYGLSSFLEQRLGAGIQKVKHTPFIDTINKPLEWFAKAWNSDPRFFFLSAHNRKAIESSMPSLDHSRENIVCMHIRSGSYKNNEQNPGMGIRSVDPFNYQLLVSRLVGLGYKVFILTADPITVNLDGAETIVADTPAGIVNQWDQYEKAKFFIGTSSGMVHLCKMANYCALLTDWPHMPNEMMLGPHHLVATKRFFLKQDISHLSIDRRITLFVNNWELTSDCLVRYVDYRSLTPEELADALDEYLSFISCDHTPQTINDILVELDFPVECNRYFNWNISSTTALDLRRLLFC